MILLYLILSGAIAFGIYKLLYPRGPAETAGDLGRKWMTWIICIVTITVLPKFFNSFDIEQAMIWLVGIIFYGGVAFLFGWIIGLCTIKKGKTVLGASQTVPQQALREYQNIPPAHVSETSYYIFLEDTVEGPFPIETLNRMLAIGHITPDTQCCIDGSDEWNSIKDLYS